MDNVKIGLDWLDDERIDWHGHETCDSCRAKIDDTRNGAWLDLGNKYNYKYHEDEDYTEVINCGLNRMCLCRDCLNKLKSEIDKFYRYF